MRSFRYASSVDSRALFCARLKKKGCQVEIGGVGGDGWHHRPIDRLRARGEMTIT